MTTNIDSIPFYYATIDDTDTGIVSISLVDKPAVEVDWLMFSKTNKVTQLYSVNKLKHQLTGVIMLADTPIYRLDSNNKPYYVVYTKEVIKQMAIKMLNKDKTFDNIDTEHNGILLNNQSLVLIEIFIKDSNNGINTVFPDIPDGSLIATYKVNNEDIWQECLKGTYNGFSLSGLFNLTEVTEKTKIDQYNNLINTKMNFKSILKKVLLKYSEVTTDDGTVWVLDGDLAEGVAPVDEEGNAISDGDYTIEDQIVTVKDGVVESIKPKEEPKEEPVEAAEETPAEPTEEPAEEPVYATQADLEAVKSELESLKATVEALSAKLSEPAADPISEEYNKVVNTSLEGAARFLSTLKK